MSHNFNNDAHKIYIHWTNTLLICNTFYSLGISIFQPLKVVTRTMTVTKIMTLSATLGKVIVEGGVDILLKKPRLVGGRGELINESWWIFSKSK